MKRHTQRRTAREKQCEQAILQGRVRRDGLGITLFVVSALGVALNGIVFPRLGRIGGSLQQISTGILFARELRFVAVNARRQRALPRLLSIVELITDGVATAAGFWIWTWQPFASQRARKKGTVRWMPWARRRHPGDSHRSASLSRSAAVLSFVIHTVRLAIYLAPSRGLQGSSAD